MALAGAAAISAVAALYLLLQQTDSSRTAALGAAGEAAALPTPVATTGAADTSLWPDGKPSRVAPAAGNSPTPETRQKLETLLRQFNASRSTRQFIATALKDARHGGVIYAMAATTACDTFRSSRDSARPPAQSSQAQQSAALLEARCDITGEEVVQQLSTAMETKAVDLASDPLFAMLVPGPSGKSRDESLRRAQVLLASGDPIAMEGLVHLDFRDPLGETPYFDGRHYRSSADRDLMDDAWLLVECGLGVSCDADATQTLLLCATRDWCGSSVAEAMDIGRGPDGTLAQVQALAHSLLSAIRVRRAAAFVPET